MEDEESNEYRTTKRKNDVTNTVFKRGRTITNSPLREHLDYIAKGELFFSLFSFFTFVLCRESIFDLTTMWVLSRII